MDPQLLMPSPAAEFNFDSASTSPYATAPSSPNTLFPKFFYTATTSHHASSPINHNAVDGFESTDTLESSQQVVDEQKNEGLQQADDDMDFAFEFSGQLERPSISDAEELFDGGRIRPLEPQPQPPPPPKIFGEMGLETPKPQTQILSPRGRERTGTAMRHKVSRSLSPLGVADVRSDDYKVSTTQSSPFGFTWYNKWNLKNLLLFRSTSEGSATTSDDQLKKYAIITKGDHDVKNSSFRSDGGSVGGSSRRMKRKMSAHEIHYTANRAVAEEMRRKTFLPYKSGLLGCLGFSQDLRDVSRRR
ncbi:hypothetical protein HanRHA438_Chr03g0121651 [Helianthus annuus]|uniref:Uncharacterized protein n=1 Tax=Helianthus annuus TaxID=4232 RepID=A0A251V777_HELAN|nr:uncharacterized protein LOC110929379 [Helianthus annuus]KAF5814400.1 hypothetical protein HanXRQr2_Chr03g0110631 [Helianthus annuus]KAJ0600780.1 hypothetical protein HanIR_Chr03g0121001 [Helianthus annuus]KAJ0935620.1 hypothetical protein HanRHA438_Chr03g0121651 [Helianthus annuus]